MMAADPQQAPAKGLHFQYGLADAKPRRGPLFSHADVNLVAEYNLTIAYPQRTTGLGSTLIVHSVGKVSSLTLRIVVGAGSRSTVDSVDSGSFD